MINKANTLLILILLLVSSNIAKANSVVFRDSIGVRIETNSLKLDVQIVKSNIVKLSYRLPDEIYGEPTVSMSYIVEKNKIEFTENDEYYSLITDSVEVRVTKPDLFTMVYRKADNTKLIDTIRFETPNNYRGIQHKIDSTEGVYGMGSHAVPFNRSGTILTLFNWNDFGYEFGKGSLNANIPLFVFGSKYAILADNFSKAFVGNSLNSLNVFKYYANHRSVDLYLIASSGHDNILKEYANLSGFQPLPPRWVLGYLQSGANYFSSSQVETIVRDMKQADFPMDAMVLDFGWFGTGKQMGNFEWQTDNWNNPKEFVSKLKQQGIKTVLISEPNVSNQSFNYQHCLDEDLLCKDQNNNVPLDRFIGAVGSLLDLTKEKSRKWINEQYERVTLRDSIAGWWCDLGEPEPHSPDLMHELGPAMEVHNIFGLLWIKSLYETLIRISPDRRPFIMSRAGWAGVQRFAALPLSGDCMSNYSSLRAQLPIMLGMGLSGSAYMHSDAGGFWRRYNDEELYARWYQFAAFSPIMRAHGATSLPIEPVYFSERVQNICRKYIKLRYSLLPYLYTLAFENTIGGVPICRAMNYYEKDTLYKSEDRQYYFGKDIIVAPIVDSTYQKNVIFPEGRWIDFENLTKYQGPNTIKIDAELEKLPLFVRSGAIIPMINDIKTTDDYSTDTLIVNYYYDPEIENSHAYIYNDDGMNPNAIAKSEYEIVNFNVENKDSLIVLQINRVVNNWQNAPKQRIYKVNIIRKNWYAIDKVLQISGTDSVKIDSLTQLPNGGICFYSKEIKNNVKFAITTNDTNGSVENELKSISSVKVSPNPAKYYIDLELAGIASDNTYSVKIFDVSGKEVISKNIEFQTDENKSKCRIFFNDTNLLQGGYYGQLTSGAVTYDFQFVIQE